MFPDRYPASDRPAARIDELEKQLPALIKGCKTAPDQATPNRAEALNAATFGHALGLPDNSSSNPRHFYGR
jgi:hypothetical protein